MNKYIIIKCKSQWAKDNIMDKVMEFGQQNIPFQVDKVHYYNIKDFVIFSGENLTSGGFENKLHTYFEENRCRVFDGIPYFKDFNEGGNWVKALDRYINGLELEQAYEEVLGTYNQVEVTQDTAVGWCDFSGLTPLFYIENEDVIAISNRQFLLAKICNRIDSIAIDYKALSWLPGQANIIGENSVFFGVKLLKPGHYIKVSDKLEIIPFEKQVWNAPKKELTDRDFDQMTEELVEQCKAIAKLPFKTLTMSLTGGMDSRLVLALALESGLYNRIDKIFTNGQEGSPEVEIAAYIAKELGIKHEARTTKQQEIELDKVWENIRYHIFRFEGSVCPWDGVGNRSSNSQLELNGMGGEIMSKLVKAHAYLDIQDLDEAVNVFENYMQRTDPLLIQKDKYTAYQKKYMNELIKNKNSQGIELNSIGDWLYIENRLTMWSGMLAANTFAKVKIFPLANFKNARIAFQGEYENRQISRFHFEIIKRLNKKLAQLPFLGKSWDKRLEPYLGDIIPASPYVSKQKVESKNLVVWQWKMIDERWEEIQKFLLENPNTGLFEIIDYDKLKKIFENKECIKQVIHVKQLLSIIGMQILLTGTYKKQFEGNVSNTTYHSNIDNLIMVRGEGKRIDKLALISNKILESDIKKIRIDPIDKQCDFIIGKVSIEIEGHEHIISEDGRTNLVANKNVKVVQMSERYTLYSALNNDPNFMINIPKELNHKLGYCIVAVEVVVFESGKYALYYDLGMGMSEKYKVSVSICGV